MGDSIVLVNDRDEEIGYGEKMEVHRIGQLHRAFSLVIVDRDDRMLLQKRASNKYHSGGLWTNACCSHPREGENIEDAVRRRVSEELGLDISDPSVYELYEMGKFKYIKHFNGFTEHEIDHVFILQVDGDIDLHLDANEIEELKWIDFWDVGDLMLENPGNFTAWFFAVYYMYRWTEIWNPTFICAPFSSELLELLEQKMEDIFVSGLVLNY